MNLRSALLCAGALAFLVTGQGPAHAVEPTSGGGYKRIKAPQPGSRPKVTVQITPDEHAARPFAPSTGTKIERPEVAVLPAIKAQPDGSIARPSTQAGRYGDFWTKVSPELAQAGAGRLDEAIRALTSTGVAAPRLQRLQEIARERGIDILRSTIGTSVSPALVLAVISVESSGRPEAVSKAGAQGLMQLMPATAKRFGVKDSLSPGQNIAGGVKYLDWLMKEFDRDPILVLAGYNAGEGAVRQHRGVPPYAETRDYVPKVLAAFQVARALCATPPELISDGCVFQTMQ
ncbi:lytic transglycosylase domain-containing protein [Ruegeria sediminis]|uniref:Lytic transglycosylase domain-containing protein n=1 Tax=Ruegeria sediminis TaxID=2583820 RepID=A0ABY2WYN5_9RHOB|nr:lytic transglycosylase domain-containing protein [Ruegeria sediminis]TMV07716.1 lytic transglycosylase domain-containing protein [Ruegeria sediminis]